jgi:hypothetical protein
MKTLKGAASSIHGAIFDFDDRAIYQAIAHNKSVTPFVKIEREDVNTNLLKGEFTFHDLDMVKGGFEKAAPIQMRQGYIECVDVKIPFGHLATKPMLVEVRGLYIVFGALPEGTVWEEPKKPKKGLKKEKKKKKKPSMQAPSVLSIMCGSIFKRIKEEVALCGYPMVDNCRMRFENIHLRFELDNADGTTSAQGIMLHSLTIQRPSDEVAEACSLSKAQVYADATKEDDSATIAAHTHKSSKSGLGHKYKKSGIKNDLHEGADVTKEAEMRKFSVYCDVIAEPVDLGEQLHFVKQMKKLITSPHTYVLVSGFRF